MGSAEFREGPYGLSIDYIHAPLKAGIGTRDIIFSGATSGLDINIGTAMFLYRPVALPDQYVDVGLGVPGLGARRRYRAEPGPVARGQRIKRPRLGGPDAHSALSP